MDDIYHGPHHPTADIDYPHNALMSPDTNNLMMYQQYNDQSSLMINQLGFQSSCVVSHDQSSSINYVHHHQNQRDDHEGHDDEGFGVIKSKIASHPSYPKLLDAYIDCQKVGAPPEIVCLLDEMRREKDLSKQGSISMCFGFDPELDEFMEKYCDVLAKYKSDLSRPFDEATSYLNDVETQLVNLCNDDGAGALSSDEELSRGEIEIQDDQMKIEDRQLKDNLLRRYGKHISSLKLEFSKKKKKGKLPKEARQTLLEWWDLHCKWPYPTETDKIALAESTGLDQKQINNWFINQRKRHWKSPENMQLAIMDNLPAGHFLPDDQD